MRHNCKSCGVEFEYEGGIEALNGVMMFIPPCSKCLEERRVKAKAEEEADARRLAKARWNEMCPPIYRETDSVRLDQEKLKQVLEWKFNKNGILMLGPTRKGKTRIATLLLERLVVEERRDVIAFYGQKFAHQCARAFGEHQGEAWSERVSKAGVVFFDDLGKEKLTERVESELFGIIETRTSYNRPVIITTNFDGRTLAMKMSPDRGAPLVERLREFCNVIDFS